MDVVAVIGHEHKNLRSAVIAAERAIDRALAPKKWRLVPPRS
jgi:hypothetical protein